MKPFELGQMPSNATQKGSIESVAEVMFLKSNHCGYASKLQDVLQNL